MSRFNCIVQYCAVTLWVCLSISLLDFVARWYQMYTIAISGDGFSVSNMAGCCLVDGLGGVSTEGFFFFSSHCCFVNWDRQRGSWVYLLADAFWETWVLNTVISSALLAGCVKRLWTGLRSQSTWTGSWLMGVGDITEHAKEKCFIVRADPDSEIFSVLL